MVADIARVTYDPTRQYRSLIYQQGRVTLEADNNEGAQLETEALRLETIDIIGPAGTPDDGYKVGSGSGPGGVAIGDGIYYLGGWRLKLDAAIDLSAQPDWINAGKFTVAQGNLVVALLLTEQSVGAVEDQALREVALGGPDSAARSRLMQHFRRIPTKGSTCADGAATVLGLLKEDGVTIDKETLQLLSTAQLQAGFVPGPPNTDPCTPVAAGGYLGADNQMVRVTVVKYDATGKTGTLLWGWNDASLLYRATMSDPLTLTLTTVPVDQEHSPQQNQMVEILRSEAKLGDGNFIAAEQGFVVGLAQGYSADTQQIALKSALPADYQSDPNPLFVRLWQADVNFDSGKATALDNVSGITVAITMDALPSHIAARPFWRFAVRPSTPQNIYPQRYADAPQPPDGPRQWLDDLAVVEALASGSKLLADCRPKFLPLTEQSVGACCGTVLGPDDVAAQGGLQAVIDGLEGGATVLSLRTGTYKLTAPLALTAKHDGLTIEGCTNAVTIEATGSDLSPFLKGLVTMDAVRNVTLRRLSFAAPVVALKPGDRASPSLLVCLMVNRARSLTVEECDFALTPPSTDTAAIGAGIVVLGATLEVELRRNVFSASKRGGAMFGVLAIVTNNQASAELDQWEVSNNRFQGLDYGVVGFAQLGLVTCRANIATGCGTGFVFIEANIGQTNGFLREALQETDTNKVANLGQPANAVLRPDILAGIVDKFAPVTDAATTLPRQSISGVARGVLRNQLKSSGVALYKSMSGTVLAAKTTDLAAKGSAPAQNAAPKVTIDTASFDKIDTLALAAELYERELTPAIRLEDNEVTLNALGSTPWVGLGVALSPDEPGSVIVSGNRVTVPDATTAACGLLFPVGAVVTGNLFAQLAAAPAGSTATWCLILITNSPAIMVAANMVGFFELVLPLRASPATTTAWEFLNTTG